MRLMPLGVLILVPALLAAAPDAAPVETAAWQPAAISKIDLPSPPAAAALSPPPALRSEEGSAPIASPVPAPALRTEPVNPVATPPLAGPVAEALIHNYGPQRLSFPGGVAAAFDVPYQTWKGFRPLTLDIYQPAPKPWPMPLIVFVHGGGWNGGDTRHAAGIADFPAALAALAAQGYVVASVNYRLSGEARFPAALMDVKAAIRWLKSRANDAHIDVTRTAVWGEASGGQLAALAGLTCGVSVFEQPDLPKDAPSDCVQAVVDWYGTADLKAAADKSGGFTTAPASDVGEFLGCEPSACPPGLTRIASPLSYISATSPAFLIQHGGADNRVPPEQSQKLAAALKAANVPVDLVIYPNLAQGFSRAGVPDAGASREAMDRVSSFLAKTFPAGPMNQKTAQRRGPLY